MLDNGSQKKSVYDVYRRGIDVLQNIPELSTRVKELPPISREEYEKVLATTNLRIKRPGQGAARGTVFGELLLSQGYSRCRPVILRDWLNGFSTHLHYDNNICHFSHQQHGVAKLMPDGIYQGLIITSNLWGDTFEDVKYGAEQLRPDIIDFAHYHLDVKERYDVCYDPRADIVYIDVEKDPEIKRLTGLRNQFADLPEFRQLGEFLYQEARIMENFSLYSFDI